MGNTGKKKRGDMPVCLSCDGETPIIASHDAGMIIYRCHECGSVTGAETRTAAGRVERASTPEILKKLCQLEFTQTENDLKENLK